MKTMKKNRIKEVRIERVFDEMADTDFIGKYTDKDDNWNICSHCGEYIAIVEEPNQRAEEIEDEIVELENKALYNENKDDIKAEKEVKEIEELIELLKKELAGLELHDCPHSNRKYNYFLPYAGGEKEGTEDYQKYGKQDFARMESLNNGDWNFIGIIAKAEIVTESGIMQTIRSGGLWGIESDSGDYLDEVGKEELVNLRSELMALGFGKRAIDYAFKTVETIDK